MAGGINRPLLPSTGATPDERRLRTGLGAIVRQFLDSGAFLARLLPGVQLRTVASGVPVALAWGSMNRVPTSDAIMLRLPSILPNMVGVPLEVTKTSATGIAFVSPAGKALDGVTSPTVDGSATGVHLTGAGVTAFRTDGTNWFSARGGTQSVLSSDGRTIQYHDTTHSPVALYQFNGNTLDSSGNGHHLTVATGVIRYAPMAPGLKGAFFENSPSIGSGFAMLRGPPGVAALQLTGDMTVEMLGFFRVYRDPSFPAVVVTHSGVGSAEASNTLYRLSLEGTLSTRYQQEHGAGVADTYDEPSGQVMDVTLSHFAFTRASGVVRFYGNGQLAGAGGAGSTGMLPPSGGASGVLWVGGDPNGPYNFAGYLASLKIINRALSEDEVKNEVKLTLGPVFGTRF